MQKRTAAAHRVLTDFLFFFGNDGVQAVKRLVGDVLLNVGIFFFDQSEPSCLTGKVVVLRGQTNFFSGLSHNRQKLQAQRYAGFLGKKISSRGLATHEDIFCIVDVHGPHGADQQVTSHGHSGFSSAVDRSHQLVNALALAQVFKQLGGIFKIAGQRNANFRVAKESIGLAQQGDSSDGTFFEGDFQAAGSVCAVDARQIAECQGMGLLVCGQYQYTQRADAGLVEPSALHGEVSKVKNFKAVSVCRRAITAAIFVVGAVGLYGCSGPQMAPDSTFVLLDGSKQTTADMKGRVTLVNFWATSCAPCIAEMPKLISTHNRYKAQGFDTVAVAMRYDPPSYVVSYSETRKLPFKVAIDNTGNIAKAWGDVERTPTAYLVNKRGEIVKSYVGEPDFSALHQLIEKLLADTPG